MKNSIEEKALMKFAELMVEKIQTIQKDWKKPWFTEGSLSWPKNLQGREYNGMNALGLIMLCEKNEWKLPYFCTFDRVAAMNFKKNSDGTRGPLYDAIGNELPRVSIKKGEKSFPVFITSFTVVHSDSKEKIKWEEYKALSNDEKKDYKVYPKMNVYNVFNVAQTNLEEARPELYKKLAEECKVSSPLEKSEDKFSFPAMDNIIQNNKWVCPIVPTKGDNCYYSISKDSIVIPLKEQFFESSSYYCNAWHEMAHSTGAESRLGRLKPSSFGSREYAVEELVAELTAALTAQRYGIAKYIKNDSAPYLKSWLDSLNEEPEFIKTVLMDVKKAASMLTLCIDDEIALMAIPEKKKQKTMYEQYKDLKAKHPDAVLLFRCGDFYESYEEDAKVCAQVLGITLTRSSKSKIDMAGFPYHALDTYLPKLIRSGHRVAICDQLETPAA